MAEGTDDSYLKNCLVLCKPDQTGAMFMDHPDGLVMCRLDGYAIVPREDYERLVKLNAETSEKRRCDPKSVRAQALRDQSWASLGEWKQELESMASGGPIDPRLAQKVALMVLADMACGDHLVISIEPPADGLKM